jgi:hypothetical protein
MRLDLAQDIVRVRCHGLCEGCGQYGPVHVHHRRARGMGGTYREEAESKNDPTNLLALCPTVCHPATEHADTWMECEGKGWRLEHSQRDPRLTPALLHTVNGYGWWLLDGNGGYHWIDWPLEKRITWREDDDGEHRSRTEADHQQHGGDGLGR